jgi:alpha(1,3/1,4) fucosyltransferase
MIYLYLYYIINNMKLGINNYYDTFNKDNNIFDSNFYTLGNNLSYPFVLLKSKLKSLGHTIDTLDNFPYHQFDKILFIDYPNKNFSFKKLDRSKTDLYLISMESEIIRSKNYLQSNLKIFKKIFFWKDDYSFNEQIVKFQLPNFFPLIKKMIPFNQKKLITLISSNKSHHNNNELYSKREIIVNWFLKFHPNEFSLYGFGWSKKIFKKHFSFFNRFKFLTDLLNVHRKKEISFYKGNVKNKIDVLRLYKFCICFENISGINGYITEKIFDCFFSKTIPIYLGAPNITNYIPKDCFIDFRDFPTIDLLYDYIKKMDEADYLRYINNAQKFISSDQAKIFSADAFSDVIIKNILR